MCSFCQLVSIHRIWPRSRSPYIYRDGRIRSIFSMFSRWKLAFPMGLSEGGSLLKVTTSTFFRSPKSARTKSVFEQRHVPSTSTKAHFIFFLVQNITKLPEPMCARLVAKAVAQSLRIASGMGQMFWQTARKLSVNFCQRRSSPLRARPTTRWCVGMNKIKQRLY